MTTCRARQVNDQCRAYQVSDQMLCPCGKQWDVNDPEPPECGKVSSKQRTAYLAFINRLFGTLSR